MKVSVVVSAYNGQKYIIEQLDSLRKQTRKIDEVIIADDRSTDDTAKIVQEYIDTHQLKNWIVQVNEHNKGWRRNFMEAMWNSQGDLVFPCDQDDIWREDKVEIMAKIMEENPQIEIISSNYCEFFEDGKERIDPWPNDKQLMKVPLTDNYMLVKSPGCTYCVRRSLLNLSKNYWQSEYPHDALLWRLGLFSGSLYVIKDDLIRWRNHSTSAFAKESKDLKTVHAKKQWIKLARLFNKTMREYVDNNTATENKESQRVLDKTDHWLDLRESFYNTKNPLKGIKLAAYWGCYPRKRQYLGDWYLIYIKK